MSVVPAWPGIETSTVFADIGKLQIDLKAKLVNGSQGVIDDFVPCDRLEPPTEPQKHNYEKDPEGYRRAMERYRHISHFIDTNIADLCE